MAPIIVNGADIGAQGWCGAVFIWYGIEPPYLPHHCDGCGVIFTVTHSLNFKKGVLITAQHDELPDRVVDLAYKALTPTNVRNNPLITPGCALRSGKANQGVTAVPNKWPGIVL